MLLGLDLGTGSVKALSMSETGAVHGEASVTYAVRSPRTGWAESLPEDWWEAAAEAVDRYGPNAPKRPAVRRPAVRRHDDDFGYRPPTSSPGPSLGL